MQKLSYLAAVCNAFKTQQMQITQDCSMYRNHSGQHQLHVPPQDNSFTTSHEIVVSYYGLTSNAALTQISTAL